MDDVAIARELRKTAEEGELTRREIRKATDLLAADERWARQNAALALGYAVREGAELPERTVDRLIGRLEDDHDGTRAKAGIALAAAAEDQPDAVVPATDRLVEFLESDDDEVRRAGVFGLAMVAEARPGAVESGARRLADRLDDRRSANQAFAAWALAAIGQDDRETVSRLVDDPTAAFEEALRGLRTDRFDRSAFGRRTVMRALARIADPTPLAVRPVVDVLSEYLDDPETRAESAEVLAAVAEADPSAIEDERPEIRERARAHDLDELRAALDDPGDGGPTGATGPDRPGGPPDAVPTATARSLAYGDIDAGERIGRGGDAVVYRATVETDDGAVPLAVKEPRPGETLRTETVERFVREAETWRELDDHEGVVGVVDYDDRPLPWIAMEYMDAGDLRDRLEADPPELREALWILVRVTDAVKHAHDHGVSHLDLKPANVLFRGTADGEWDVPKVGDWGLASLPFDRPDDAEGVTATYAAPEQVADGYGGLGHHTDVYQVGAVGYELVTGDPPFDGAPAAVARAVAEESVTPPTEVDPSLPGELDEVLLTALSTEPSDRFDHVVLMRERLAAVYDSLS